MQGLFDKVVDIIRGSGEDVGYMLIFTRWKSQHHDTAEIIMTADGVTIEAIVAPVIAAISDVEDEEARKAMLEYVFTLLTDGVFMSQSDDITSPIAPGSATVS